MSRSWFQFSQNFLFRNSKDLSAHDQFLFLGTIITSHISYAYITKNEKTLIVDKKYQFTRNGFTEFMIVDRENNHYNINNSIWYWKFNSIEDWNAIKTNQKINVCYYGFRIPILGLFPNVYRYRESF